MLALIGGVVALVGTCLGLWLIPIYKKLSKNEKAIREIEDAIDSLDPNTARSLSYVVPAADDLVTQNHRKRLNRKLERLKQERQFLLDKLPFFKH